MIIVMMAMVMMMVMMMMMVIMMMIMIVMVMVMVMMIVMVMIMMMTMTVIVMVMIIVMVMMMTTTTMMLMMIILTVIQLRNEILYFNFIQFPEIKAGVEERRTRADLGKIFWIFSSNAHAKYSDASRFHSLCRSHHISSVLSGCDNNQDLTGLRSSASFKQPIGSIQCPGKATPAPDKSRLAHSSRHHRNTTAIPQVANGLASRAVYHYTSMNTFPGNPSGDKDDLCKF